jgi:hypothetical protein
MPLVSIVSKSQFDRHVTYALMDYPLSQFNAYADILITYVSICTAYVLHVNMRSFTHLTPTSAHNKCTIA